MKARFFKSSYVATLSKSIKANLALYRNGNFKVIADDPDYYFETQLDIDESKLSQIHCYPSNLMEVENCKHMFNALGTLSFHLARDERFWVFLTHTVLLDYSRNRWPIPEDDEKAVKHILTHFFCVGNRGIERDNAASRLWWIASLCNRASNLSLHDSLSCLLHQSDVRASIIERPTTSQNLTVFSAILGKLHKSYNSNRQLFERENFRSIMKLLNLAGGVKLLGALPVSQVEMIIDDCINKTI